jgi:hypothetical protein
VNEAPTIIIDQRLSDEAACAVARAAAAGRLAPEDERFFDADLRDRVAVFAAACAAHRLS